MTEHETYPDFEVDIEAKLGDMWDKVKEGVDWLWEKWDGCWADNLRFASPAIWLYVRNKRQDLVDSIEALWQDFEDFCADVWDKVDDWTGNPFELMQLNGFYINAASDLRDEATVLTNIRDDLKYYWSGTAYDRFCDVVDIQLDCVNGAAESIADAATGVSNAAKSIRSSWRTCIDALLDYLGEIVNAIQESTDVGKVITFDVGPGLKVFLDAIIKLETLLNNLGTYFDDNATVNQDFWSQLQKGKHGGLDSNNDWASVGSRASGPLHDHTQWAGK